MNPTHSRLKSIINLLLLGLILALVLAGSSKAQFYFGKNKVQYTDFNWRVMTTEHFRIYFYEEEQEIAKVAAQIAEDAYHPLAAKFNIELEKTTPLIIYSSPSHFSQTNVVPGLLPESVGGFTEFLKGRVVLPFHGSYFDFKHVIVHELVHVFTLAKLGSEFDRQARSPRAYPPLWFIEGLAEFWSEEWDTEADMIIKDMVLSGQLLTIPEFWRVQGSYFMYKLGQSVCNFINDEYGPDKIPLLFENWQKGRSFDEIIQWTLGDNLEEVSRKWEYSLKKKYFPEMEGLGLPRMEAQQVTSDGYCVKGVPIKWDDGHGEQDWVVFMAYRLGYAGIYMKPMNKSKDGLRTIIKGERSTAFESLHLLRTGIDATDSGLVVFSSKSKERDYLYIYDLNDKGIAHKFALPDLIAARSPRFSPDQSKVAFYGIRKSGYTDLYILDVATGEYRALTEDIFYDIDPVFSRDSRKLVFASDRSVEGETGATNLFEMDIASGAITQLTWGHFNDQSPEIADEGIFFSSNREGSFNLFLLKDDGSLTRQSTYVTGALDPRITSDGKTLTFSGYERTMFQVFSMELPEKPEPIEQFVTTADSLSGWSPGQIDAATSQASIKYDTDYSFDIAQSTIAYDPIFGSVGGFQAAFSDMLGNHAYYFLVTNTADTKDEFFKSFNVGITYINQKKRLNWGVGAFHLYDEYYNDRDQFFFERQAGLIGLISYPFSKFNRLDVTNFLRYDKKERRYGLEDRDGLLWSTYASWVYDNSLWEITGPIEGRRYNLTLGVTHSLSDNVNWNRVAFGDIRHYFRLGRASAFASRLFAYTSDGLEPQRIYFGGSWNFRGFDRREFFNRNILFASHELRFPLIDNLLIGFPIGGLGFQGIRGALFFDVGSAWEDEFDRFLGSYGWGFRVGLGYLIVLRFDFAKTTDFRTTSHGFDFDFFFGWNF